MTKNPDTAFNHDRKSVLTALNTPLPPTATLPLPPLPPATVAADLIKQFMTAAIDNSATVERLGNEQALPMAIKSCLHRRRLPRQIVCTSEWAHLNWAAAEIQASFRAPHADDLCGLSGAVAAAADCGAILSDSAHPHQLTAGLLPPHHFIAVRAQTIAPSLCEILAPPNSPPPRALVLSCGPSRTADIEQTLTLGVHGPLTVHVMIV